MRREENIEAVRILGLKLPTDPRWVNIAEKSIEEILTDHAFCEQKAATMGISLIVKFSDKSKIVEELTPLVAEEWGHFRRVLKELKNRGLELGKQRKDEYVVALHQQMRKGGSRDQMMMEYLLVSAMIEARSCERFRLLSLYCNNLYLRSFYHEFMVSEAGHYRLFLDLAKFYLPLDAVKKRWDEMRIAESEIMAKMTLRGDRIH
ncbi:MAG: tRNA 2-methylthio-N6-isopentenyl adenosine(37) hydroxylase MiaE [Flavobacteriales bacterium]|nr:MAG: tRNA 2-methylthio-N6-isopentenyl adenosine(37) hydroxylase MiaE [Flavobacteriales bacterium]